MIFIRHIWQVVFLLIVFTLTACGESTETSAFSSLADDSNNPTNNPPTTQTSTDASPPETPTGLEIENATGDQIILRWKSSSDNVATVSYRLYRSDLAQPLITVSALRHIDNSVIAGRAYSYQVSALDAAGNESTLSEAVVANTSPSADLTPPSTPQNLNTGGITSNSIALSWNASTDNIAVQYYRIYRNNQTTPLATTGTTSITDSNLAASTQFSYRVSAVDTSGNESPLSASISATTNAAPDTIAPTTPGNLNASNLQYNRVTLNWSAASDNVGVVAYRLYKNGSAIPLVTTATLSFTDTGLAAETGYNYRVDAIDAAGNASSLSATLSITTPAAPDTSAPTTPGGLTANGIGENELTLHWNASTDNVGVTGYHVYRDGSMTPILTTNTLSFTDSGLNSDQSYSYRVAAFDAAGNLSPLSSTFSVTTTAAPDTTAPSTPAGLSANGITENQITLNWNAATDNVAVTGYRIYRDGSTTPLNTASSLSFTDSGLNSDQAYSYRVSAVDAAGNESTQSSSLMVNTLAPADTTPPTAPGSLSSTNIDTDRLTLNWNAATDNVAVTGYRIYRDGINIAGSVQPSFTDSGLNSDQTYQYQVSAVDEAGNESTPSAAHSVTTLAVTQPQSVQLSWVSPTQFTDDSCMSSNHQYRISYGSSASNYSQQIEIDLNDSALDCQQTGFDSQCNQAIMTCTYTTPPIAVGNWYFAVQAYSSTGILSGFSNEAMKTIQ